MLIDSSRDVTKFKIDLELSTLKPLHLNTLIQISNYFKTSDGEGIIKSGFQVTEIPMLYQMQDKRIYFH